LHHVGHKVKITVKEGKGWWDQPQNDDHPTPLLASIRVICFPKEAILYS